MASQTQDESAGQLQGYRQHLVLAEQKAQETYDKTLLSLSGGALGISFAFVDKFLGDKGVGWIVCLVLAWGSWGLSVGVVLASHFCSRQALRTAIQQVDKGEIYIRKPGGRFATATELLNVAGGLLFLIGVVFMIVFVGSNLGVMQ